MITHLRFSLLIVLFFGMNSSLVGMATVGYNRDQQIQGILERHKNTLRRDKKLLFAVFLVGFKIALSKCSMRKSALFAGLLSQYYLTLRYHNVCLNTLKSLREQVWNDDYNRNATGRLIESTQKKIEHHSALAVGVPLVLGGFVYAFAYTQTQEHSLSLDFALATSVMTAAYKHVQNEQFFNHTIKSISKKL